jgi:hypothetical protein
MAGLRGAVIVGLVAAGLFGAVTLAALEGREVVVLRTRDERGVMHETRTWIADADGAWWIEAANPERPFLRHIAGHPDTDVWRAGQWWRCRATALPNPAGHARIRRLLAARYGWADRWVGMLTDTSRSSAVRLVCVPTVG